MILQAYFNDPKIKKKYVTQMINHRKADQLIQGVYWQNGKGCAVGCIIHSECHNKFETDLGLSEWLAHLVDFLFENLQNGDSMTFPEKVLKAIPVGVNLDMTYHKFCIFLLKEICKYDDKKYPDVKSAIDNIIKIHEKILTFNKREVIDEKERSAAWSAAWSVAGSAAGSAARSAAESAAWSAAWSVAVKNIAKKLIELLNEADKN